MANRLKQCLASLILENHSAFIEGRLLTYNTLIAFELNHYIHRKTQGKNGVVGLKLDISKAYDRLEWTFLESMMIKFGFNRGHNSRSKEYEKYIGEVQESEFPGNYLGLPMYVGRRKNNAFRFLTERVSQKLQNWSNKKMSKGGKLVLLKTAAQAIPNFWMNLFLIPTEGWRSMNGDNPFVTRLMKAKYYPNTSFIDAKLGSNPSYMWRSILQAQEVIQQGCRRRIGDGESTNIWKMPWLPCRHNGYLVTTMPSELEHVKIGNLMADSKDRWDEEILQDMFEDRDIELIKSIPVSKHVKQDSWFWIL
ncbi:uncharacterized protein LOC141711691 [Apium graveolens]|uniref:uncharacterized protein LOC141711691 n=1 Tax=Apium graveolens TaxID=4045 RepID=UPI003D79189D